MKAVIFAALLCAADDGSPPLATPVPAPIVDRLPLDLVDAITLALVVNGSNTLKGDWRDPLALAAVQRLAAITGWWELPDGWTGVFEQFAPSLNWCIHEGRTRGSRADVACAVARLPCHEICLASSRLATHQAQWLDTYCGADWGHLMEVIYQLALKDQYRRGSLWGYAETVTRPGLTLGQRREAAQWLRWYPDPLPFPLPE